MGKTSKDEPSPSMKPVRVKSAVAAAVAAAAIVVAAAVVEAEAIEDAASQRPLFIIQSYPSSLTRLGGCCFLLP